MYNGKLVSCYFILNKLYRDLNLDFSINFDDAVNWLGEALSEIKSPVFYVDKVTDGNIELGHQDFIEIVDGKGKLPCDLFTITQTACVQFCDQLPSVNAYITGIAFCDYQTGESCTTGDGSQLCNDLACVQTGCNTCSTCNSLDSCNCNPNSKYYSLIPMRWNTNTFYKTHHGTNLDWICNSDYTYTVNNNYIFTSFKEGKVCMAYKAIPTDEAGLPLIPDMQSVINYVTWYLSNKISFQMWMNGKISDKVYEEIKGYMQLYYMKAKNEGKMPRSMDEWQSYINQRLRFYPDVFAHNKFYRNLQRPQLKLNQPHGLYGTGNFGYGLGII